MCVRYYWRNTQSSIEGDEERAVATLNQGKAARNRNGTGGVDGAASGLAFPVERSSGPMVIRERPRPSIQSRKSGGPLVLALNPKSCQMVEERPNRHSQFLGCQGTLPLTSIQD